MLVLSQHSQKHTLRFVQFIQAAQHIALLNKQENKFIQAAEHIALLNKQETADL